MNIVPTGSKVPWRGANLLVATVALGWVVAPPPATAQAPKPPAETAPGWRVECANDGKALDCRAMQEIVQQENRQLVAALVVRVPAETKKPVIMIQLPLGILVSAPIGLHVDPGPSENYAVQTCTAAGCFVGAALGDAMLSAMRAGKQLQISFQNTDKRSVTVPMPLSGFAVAYDKLK
jgi:invasion protein IalB